jgi:hypothetical protein
MPAQQRSRPVPIPFLQSQMYQGWGPPPAIACVARHRDICALERCHIHTITAAFSAAGSKDGSSSGGSSNGSSSSSSPAPPCSTCMCRFEKEQRPTHHCIQVIKALHLRRRLCKFLTEGIAQVVRRVGGNNQNARTVCCELNCKAAGARCLADTALASYPNPTQACLINQILQRWRRGTVVRLHGSGSGNGKCGGTAASPSGCFTALADGQHASSTQAIQMLYSCYGWLLR